MRRSGAGARLARPPVNGRSSRFMVCPSGDGSLRPRWNWNPSKVVLFDLETQSACSLPKVGTKAYLSHPTTRLMSAVFLADGCVTIWVPPGRMPGKLSGLDVWPEGFDRSRYRLSVSQASQPPQWVRHAIEAGHTFAAHNAAGFDAPAWGRLIGGPVPEFCDTLPSARAAGLPGGLDALGQVFLGRGKDKGKDALKLLYTAKVKPNGEVVYPVGTVPLWRDMLRYNVADVLLLERVWAEVQDYGEADVLDVHQRINARGIAVDRVSLHRLSECWSQLQAEATEQVGDLTEDAIGEDGIRSVPKVQAWLRKQGVQVASLNRKELERLYADPLAYLGEIPDGVDIDKVIAVLKLRQTATRISKGKLQRLAEMLDEDGRVRDLLVYWGAHTGRWTSKGVQIHNLTKGVSKLDIEGLYREPLTLDRIKAAADAHKAAPSYDDVLSSLLRPVFCAAPGKTLLIADYAAVEARCVNWLAGQEDVLQLFRSGADVYCHMAAKIFGRPIDPDKDKDERQIGKIAVLGCLAEGTPVLTGRGWVAIEGVRLSDRVWDGVQWVSHDGVIYKGEKACINVAGVWLTPDHEILTPDGWRGAGEWLRIESTPSRNREFPTAIGSLNRLKWGRGAESSPLSACALAVPPDGLSQITLCGGIVPGVTDAPHGSNSAAIRVRTYDVLNAGPRHRFQAGGLIVSNCGYGMGEAKFSAFTKLIGADLTKVGTSAPAVIEAYRDAHPAIAGTKDGSGFRKGGLWKAYQRAAMNAVRRPGVTFDAGRCRFRATGRALQIELPSGRCLTYRGAEVAQRVPGYAIALGLEAKPMPTIVYRHSHGYEGQLYGGLLAENISQATCRDVMAVALVRCEAAGLPVVVHVHDEVVGEDEEMKAAESLRLLCRLMSEPAGWADGFPIGVEGYSCRRYSKAPFRDSVKCAALNGEVR